MSAKVLRGFESHPLRMKDNDITSLSVVLILVILAFATAIISNAFGIIFAGDDSLIRDSGGAFFGAFFAYIFVRFVSAVTRIDKRLRKHYDSLVSLSVELNEMLGIVHDNSIFISEIVKVLERGNVTWDTLHQILVNRKHFEALYSPDISNKLFSVYYDARRINNDMDNFLGGYKIMRSALISGSIKHEKYVEEVQRMIPELKKLNLLQEEQFMQKVLQLLAEVSILLERDKPLSSRLLTPFIKYSLYKPTSEEIEKELQGIKNELAGVSSKMK